MLSKDQKAELVNIISLAERRVRTTEGSKQFGKPIGSVIGGSGDPANAAQKRPITLERLKSLQTQFEAAKKQGNIGLMKKIQGEFTAAFRAYRALKQDPNLIRNLTGARGRADQAIKDD